MSTVRDILVAQVPRYDNDALAALANRGLLRRAQKDEERKPAVVSGETTDILTMRVGEHHIEFDRRGVAQAACSCTSTGTCQHILHAVLTLRRLLATSPSDATIGTSESQLESLRSELLAISTAELVKHAGSPGYRWAWQYLQDLAPSHALNVSGDANIVLGLTRPRVAFRYVGTGLDGLVADVELSQIEKYRVAAVLAFQVASGKTIAAPPPARRSATQQLRLGKDHELLPTGTAGLGDSRAQLFESVMRLFQECVESGLSHVSRGTYERMSTLAVWAGGAECPRLARALRRLAAHVELLVERAGGADEHQLLDEMTQAYGLVAALQGAEAGGAAASRLLGRSRSTYEESGGVELLGLACIIRETA